MLLLPIAALALLAFFLILLMMGVADACERREQARLRRVGEPIFAGMSLSAANDNARLIWATQVPALQYLEARPIPGVAAAALRPCYAAIARRYPALYEGHKFEEWLAFLENSRVVCRREGQLLLATRGQNVLDQCRRTCER